MDDYRKISNIRHTKPHKLVSRLVLQFSLPNLMKPGAEVENERKLAHEL